MDHLRSVALQPATMVFSAFEAFVGHVGSQEGRAHAEEPAIRSSPQREEGLGQGLVGCGGGSEAKARDHSARPYGGQQREALVPSYLAVAGGSSLLHSALLARICLP
jgi:hypothetical protein